MLTLGQAPWVEPALSRGTHVPWPRRLSSAQAPLVGWREFCGGGRGVGVGLHTPGPGALGVTGIELKEPVALAFGLSSLPPMHGPMDPGLRAV